MLCGKKLVDIPTTPRVFSDKCFVQNYLVLMRTSKDTCESETSVKKDGMRGKKEKCNVRRRTLGNWSMNRGRKRESGRKTRARGRKVVVTTNPERSQMKQNGTDYSIPFFAGFFAMKPYCISP